MLSADCARIVNEFQAAYKFNFNFKFIFIDHAPITWQKKNHFPAVTTNLHHPLQIMKKDTAFSFGKMSSLSTMW